MLYNSIYGNTFKLNGQNNLINIPDFFFKIYSKINNNKEKKEKLKLNKVITEPMLILFNRKKIY
jgi:hypothetical protein